MVAPQEPLPDRVLELLASEKPIPAVDDERRARMLARIREATGEGTSPAKHVAVKRVAAAAIAAPVTDAATSGAAKAGGIALLVKSKLVLAVVAFGVGAGTGATIHAVVTPSPASPSATPSSSFVASTASSLPPRPAPILPSTPASAPSVEAPPSASTPTVTVSPLPSSSSSTRSNANASRERALIDQARIAVLRGDKASALAALRTHAVEFPDGQHREERETLRRRAEALP